MPLTKNDKPGRRQLLAAGAGLLLAAPLRVLASHDASHQEAAPAAPKARKPRKPQLAMGAALAPDGAIWLAMLDSAGQLVTRRSADAGLSWSAPRPLDIGGEQPSADGENHPKIAFGPQGQVVIAYTRPLAKPFTGEIRLLHSSDGGAHFSAPATVHQDRQQITHRFESIAFDAAGRLHVVWIDKRDLEAAKKAGRDYEGAAIYRAVSGDGGASFGGDIKVADHSCECCRIALAQDASGNIVALWRHIWPGEQRDPGFARLVDGAQPVRAGEDRWKISGCPHHGGSLVSASDGGWHSVWFGVRDGVAAVRYGRLDAEGRPRAQVLPLPDDKAEHAAIGRVGPRLAVVWRSFDGQLTRWRAWVSPDEGASWQLRELGSSSASNDFARLVQDQGRQRMVALWRCDDEQGVRLAEL